MTDALNTGTTMPNPISRIRDSLNRRFGETIVVDESLAGLDELARLAGRRVHRRYTERTVDADLLRLLCAFADLIPDQPFIRTAPAFLVFLANGRRLPEISKMRGKPFPNAHLDQFFN